MPTTSPLFDVLDGITRGVQASPRAQRLVSGIAMSVQFHPAEKDSDCYLAIAAGKIATGRGKHPKPSVTVSGAQADLIEIVEGRKDITYMLSQGKVRTSGDYYHGIDLSRIALAIRQTLAAK